MKKKLLLAVMLCSFLFCSAYSQDLKTSQPSPTADIKQNFGLSQIEISYSRPGIKGRKIFGDLVPYGKVWRTGANNATTVIFGDDVTIKGKKVPAGKYGLLTIPGKQQWTIIISKQTDVTSPAAYKEEMDVMRTDVDVTKLKDALETFTIQFVNVKPTSCDLQLSWERSSVSLPIATDIDSKIMANISAAMKTDKPPYYQ